MSTSSSGGPPRDAPGRVLGLENSHPLASFIKTSARTKTPATAPEREHHLRGFAAGEPRFDVSLEKGCGLESGEELAH